VAEKLAVLREHEASGEELRPFCARVGVSTATLCKWRRLYAEGGEAALADRPNPRNGVKRAARRRFTADQRRETVEAYEKSGMTLADFAVLWGVSKSGLSKWLTRYRAEGLKGLEDRPHPGVPEGGLQRRLSAQTRTEIVRTKARFPTFGLRKVRDFLLRFHGVKVSAGSVRNTLREAGVEPPAKPRRKPKRKPQLPRRFERARAGQMWQSDITSFVLRRHSQRVYLTVFMDDHSRYVVAFGLEQQQRQELVTSALLEGIARFGKP
jgi:transposase